MVSQQPKVLHLITVFSVGGATATLITIASGLKQKGYDVHIATGYHVASEGSMFDEAKAAGLKVVVFDTMVKAVSPINDLLTLIALYRYIRREKFDVVHTHTAKAGILGRLAARLAGVPVIIHLLHLLSFHDQQPWLMRFLFIRLERLAVRLTHKILSVSQSMVDAHLQNRIGKAEQYQVIRNAVADSFFQPLTISASALKRQYAATFGFSETDFIVSKVARITPLKGQKYLVEAAKRLRHTHPHIKFLIVGSGDNADAIRTLIAAEGLERQVMMTGLIRPAQVREVIAISNVVAQTSLHEGLPVAIQQAMALRKPVVSFNLDGAREAVTEGETGFLIEASPVTETTLETLALRLAALAENTDLCQKMGDAGYRVASAQFTSTQLVEKIETLYRRLLTQPDRFN